MRERDIEPLIDHSKCYAKCMGGKLFAPIPIKFGEEVATKATEHIFAKRTGKWAGRIVAGSRVVSVLGWIWFGYHTIDCMVICSEEGGEENGCSK
jgi:hypothetical protein